MRLPVSSSLRRRLRLPHPVRRRAPTAGTVGLRNPASREPVRVRGNQVFGERSGATTGITTSSSDDEFLHTDNFFPDLSDFFDNLNMGDNDAAVKQINSSSVAAATRPPLFDGMHYKRWRTKAVLWFTNLGCFSATDARPEGPLSAEEQEKFEKVDAMFKAALFSILGDNIVDPYMAFDHGKDAWDALEAKFGVSDAGTELYVMEQYYDYRMTDERSVVEQAHEIQSLAKELEQFKCTLPDKFVAGGIIAKLPPSWRNFATSLKHKRQEFSVSDLIGSLHVEEKARAKDTRARSFEGGSSANVVQKKNFQSHKSKNKNNGKGKFDEKNKASNSTNFKRKTPYKKKGMIGVGTAASRKDFLRADGKRLTCFCSWCWKNFDKYHEPYKDKTDSPIGKCIEIKTVDHVLPEAYIEKTPFPAKMKEYSIITSVVNKSAKKPIEPEEQIKVEPAVAIVKDLVTENVEDGHIIFCEDASNIVSHPNKSRKASVPMLSVRIGDHCYYGLCDIGASISAIPYELYTEIMHEIGSCELEDIDVVIRLANRETISPIGIVRDVEVLCGKIKYPADFLEKIVTKFAGESYEFNFSKFAKTPYKADLPNDDFRVEQCASIALAPNNPLQQHLEDHESEVFREERDELDEIFLRQPILKHDLPVEDLGVTPPPKEDHVFDLKPLPDNLKYAYIDDKKTYPVIISAKLSDFEEERLLEILKKHRGAIGYTLDDLKGISPSICQHAINMEDDAKPVVEHQVV
ncbi:hypothetical protein QYE76_062338 [Lolium multiflorum]|uniref:Gag-pol polyprotein n=1 Tax=Lolium multiflorum TaxID=4521 RepID=A0AAD8S454_LOLMU|nr:hypothetical protein QYE76_062338 [Lolium multiflorum]